MNAEAQKLMDTINRLMSKGMGRDDDTIKTLEGLIEEELSKGETDDAFLQRPTQNPSIQRPGMKQFSQPQGTTDEDSYEQAEMMRQADPRMPVDEIMRRLEKQVNQNPLRMPMDRGGNLTPEEFERQNPNWRELERKMDIDELDLEDTRRMMGDWKRGPEANKYELSENMGGIFDAPPGMAYPSNHLDPQAHYGIENLKRMMDFEFDPTTQLSEQRRSFQRPSAGPSTEEELEMIMPEELEEEYE